MTGPRRAALLLVLAGLPCRSADSGSLQVEVEDTRQSNCQVYVAVYREPGSWLNDKPYRLASQGMKAGLATVPVNGLAPGKYAVFAFCDLNGNGRLDETLLGIPKEPYGFSNGKPEQYELSFDQAAFVLNSDSGIQRRRLILVRP